MDKEKALRFIKRFKLASLICAIVLFVLGVALIVVGAIFSNTEVAFDFWYTGGISIVLGVAFLLMRLIFCKVRIEFLTEESTTYVVNEIKKEEKKPHVIDVSSKPISKEEQLYSQYEELYKNGFITKEDLEKKKKELLN